MLSQKLAQLKCALRFPRRFSIELAITAAHGAKPPKRLVIVAASGEAGGSPVRAKVNVTTLGQHDSVRTIGGISYEYRPEIARLDGGRPWIRQRLSPSEHPKASSHLTLLELTEIPDQPCTEPACLPRRSAQRSAERSGSWRPPPWTGNRSRSSTRPSIPNRPSCRSPRRDPRSQSVREQVPGESSGQA